MTGLAAITGAVLYAVVGGHVAWSCRTHMRSAWAEWVPFYVLAWPYVLLALLVTYLCDVG